MAPHSLATNIRQSTLRPLGIEPEVAEAYLVELVTLRDNLGYAAADASLREVIELILTCHSQYYMAQYHSENVPINRRTFKRMRYLELRIQTTFGRFCRALELLERLMRLRMPFASSLGPRRAQESKPKRPKGPHIPIFTPRARKPILGKTVSAAGQHC